MKYTPTHKQIQDSKSWTELYIKVGLNPRNNRTAKKLQDHVRLLGLAGHLDKRQNYTIDNESFVKIVSESFSIRNALQNLGLKAAGGAYRSFHKRVKTLNLDTSHFLGQAIHKGTISKRNKNIKDYLILNGPNINSFKLKQKLFNSKIKEKVCEECFTSEWKGQPAPLHLHHINGNPLDNRLENLQILCAMCHALTKNYCGKNISGAGGRT